MQIRSQDDSTDGAGTVVVLCTWPGDRDALDLARAMVDARLAACVSVLGPMTSVYRWEGEVQLDREHQVVIKTTRERLAAVATRLRELHPYDVPELLVLSVSGGAEAYLDWVAESTRKLGTP